MSKIYFDIDSLELDKRLIGRRFGGYKVQGIDGLVYGRNGKSDIPLRTIFRRALIYSGDKIKKVVDIELELVSVEFYRREIEIAPGGHTARLQLSGLGLGDLSELIRNVCESDYVRIET